MEEEIKRRSTSEMARTSENLLLHQSREKLETLSRSTFSEFYTLIKNFQRYEESSLKKSNWIESQQQEQVALRPFFFFFNIPNFYFLLPNSSHENQQPHNHGSYEKHNLKETKFRDLPKAPFSVSYYFLICLEAPSSTVFTRLVFI